MIQPSFVIADESVSMLDVSVRIGILVLLLRMRDKFGISFVYITHDLVTARYICDRIAIMYLGKIVEIGPTEEIVHTPGTHTPSHCYPLYRIPTRRPNLPIKGYVPMALDDTFTGCRFYMRCPHISNQCREQYPEMQEVGEGHQVSCFLFNQ